MAKPARLDAELVRRGLTSSRVEARRAVESGLVTVGGVPVTKPASLVAPSTPISISGPASRFVSRGGEKLDAALDRLGVEVAGRGWLDTGASTGGFTDSLLQRGASRVIALDVGYGQLDWRLRNDDRVVVMERTNARRLTPDDVPFRPQGVVADLSFISLGVVLPALRAVARPDADFVVLVKPQFEAGRGVARGGVVRDPAEWRKALESVSTIAYDLGLSTAGAVLAHPPGPSGNREFFLHLTADARHEPELIEVAIAEASP